MPQQFPPNTTTPKVVDNDLSALQAPPPPPPSSNGNGAIAQATGIDPAALKNDLSALQPAPQTGPNLPRLRGGVQQTTSDSQYLEGIVAGQDPNLVKARNQGFLDSMGNAAAQTVVGTALDFVEGVGYLGVGELIDKVRGTEQDFGNSLSTKMAEWGKQFRQDVTPIYTSPEDEGFNPMSYKWWATNIPSIASAVSLLLPAAGATRLLGKVGGLAGRGAIRAAKGMNKLELAKKLGVGMDIIQAGEPIAMAALSRHMEGMMEGVEVYDALYQKALEGGHSEESAQQIAGEGATNTYVKNLPLIATDVLQFGLAFKTFKGMSKAFSSEKASKNLLAEIGAQVGTESFEEVYQTIAAKEAERTALIEAKLIKDDDSIYGDRLLDYLTDPEVQTAAFFGGFGGAAFGGVGGAMENRALAQQKLKNQVEAANLEKGFAAYKDDPLAFAKSVDTDVIGFSVSAIYKGRADKAQEMYEIMRDSKHEDKTPEEAALIKQRAELALSDLQQLKETYDNVFKDRTKEKSLDLTGYEMTNRAKVLTDTRHLEQAKVKQGEIVQKIAKERNLDPTYASLLQGEMELHIMRNEFKGAKVDEEIKKEKITALEKEVQATRDTIKTNNNVTDKEIDAKLAVNKEELAYATYPKVLLDVNLAQYSKDFDKLQTNEGRKEVKKEMEEFHKTQSNKDLLNLTGQITYKSTFAELGELRAAAEKLGKGDEFKVAFNEKRDKIKGAAPKYDPTNPEVALTARFEYSPMLKEYETGEIVKIADTTKTALPEQTPKAIADAVKTNQVFAGEVAKYFARTDIKPDVPKKKDSKKVPIKQSAADGNNGAAQRPEITSSTGNRSAWDLAGQQFAMKTTFENDDKTIKYSYSKIVHSADRVEHKYFAATGEVTKEITQQQYQEAFKTYSEPDTSKPLDDNIAKKMKEGFEFMNKGLLPSGAKLHLEYDFEDSWNKRLANDKKLTPHNALFEFTYYVDGNNGNKSKENRLVVGALQGYETNRAFKSDLEKQQLKTLRERVMQEVYDTGYKTGTHITSVTTKVKRVRGGRFWKGTQANPMSVLGTGQELVLGIGERYKLDDDTYSTKLNVGGHELQDKVQSDWNIQAGHVYMLIKDAGGSLVPYKIYAKKLGELPGTAEIVAEGMKQLKDAKTGEERLAILEELNEITYIKNAEYKDGLYHITKGNVEASTVEQVREENLVDFFKDFMVQIDIAKINKSTIKSDGTRESYNEDISNRELITSDLHPYTHFHSAGVVIEPIQTNDVKVVERKGELPPASTGVSTGPAIVVAPTTAPPISGLDFTLPAKGKTEEAAHFTTVEEAVTWLRPDYENQRTNRDIKDRTPLNTFVNRRYGKLLATYSDEARSMVTQAINQLKQEEIAAIAITPVAVATTPVEKKTGTATITTAPAVSIEMQPINIKKIEAGTKTTTVRSSTQQAKIGIPVGQTKIAKIGNKLYNVTNRGLFSIEEAGGKEKMLQSEGVISAEELAYDLAKNWINGKGKLYVYDIQPITQAPVKVTASVVTTPTVTTPILTLADFPVDEMSSGAGNKRGIYHTVADKWVVVFDPTNRFTNKGYDTLEEAKAAAQTYITTGITSIPTSVQKVLTPASGGTPSIPASAPKRERKTPPIITDAGSLDVSLPESQPQKEPLEFPEVKGNLDYTSRGMYETSIGFIVVFEGGTNIADTDMKTYTTKAAARGAITKYKNKQQKGKPSIVEEIGAYTPLNEESVKAWFAKNLPQVPVEYMNNIITMGMEDNYAWGVFYDNSIELYKAAPKGTEHHEAFHAVFQMFLSPAQREQILNEASIRYGISRKAGIVRVNGEIREDLISPGTGDYEVEEALADDFMRQVQEDFTNVDSLGGQISRFFKGLWEFIKSIFTTDVNIDNLFFRINTGHYANKPVYMGVATEKRYRPVANPYKTTRNIKYINSLFFQAIDNYRKQQNLGDVSDAEAVRHISSNVKKGILALYEQVFNTLSKQADHYKSLPGNNFDEIMDIIDEFMDIENGKVVRTKWYYTQAIRELSKFGIKTTGAQIKDNTVADTDRDDKQYLLNEEVEALEGWQRTAVETNGKDSLSYNVRKTLRLSTKWKITKGEVFEEAKDNYDFPEFVDFDELYNYLQVNLAGNLTIDDMIATMEELKYHRPDLYGILQKLDADPSLKSQFFTNFALTYKPHYQTRRITDRGVDQRQQSYVNTTFRTYNANRKNLHQLILNQWDTGLTTPQLNDVTDANAIIIKTRAQAYLKEYEAVIKRIQLNREVTFEDNVMLSNILKKFGMIVDPMALQREYREKTTRVNKKEKKITTPYDSYMMLVNGTRSIKTIITRIASGGNPYTGSSSETSSAKHVTRVVSKNSENLHQDNFVNGDGKQVYSYSLPTFLDKKIQEFKNQAQRQGYVDNWWFKRNKWLQDLNSSGNAELVNEFDIILADSLRLDGSKPTMYYDMNDSELDTMDLNKFDNNGTESYAYYRLPILSDSPQAPYAKFKKYSEAEIIDSLYQLALGEKDRIEIAKTTDIKIKNWNTGLNNAFKYNFVTVFNESEVDINNEQAAKAAIKTWLDAECKLEQDRLIKNGVLKTDGSFNRTVSDKSNNKQFLRNYFYNKVHANAMMTQMFGVDLAYYKNGEDFQKRFGQVFKFTKMLDITAISEDGTAVGNNYSVVYMKDNIIASELRKALESDLIRKGYSKEYAEKQGKLFDEVNQTDGQTYITLDRYKKIQIGIGQWPKEKEEAYRKIMSGKPYDPKLEILFGPIKPFYYGHEVLAAPDPKNAIVLPVQHKNSEVILFPSVANKSKELKKILKYLNDNKVDALLFDSAVKEGAHGVANNVDDLANATIHTMENKYFGIQQETPEHHIDTENRYGSQVRKEIIADIPDIDPATGKPTLIGGHAKKDIVDLYQNLIIENIKESYGKLADELGSIKNVHELLLDEIVNRNLGEFYEIAIEIRDDLKGEKVFNLPLFHPIHAKRFEQILNAVVRNRVVNQKINGGSFALMSNFGFTNELKVHRNAETGAIEYMDCYLPAWSKEWFEGYRDKNGEVDIEKIRKDDPSMLELFGYRIPTEHKYSMKGLRVKGFLPDIMSGTIMLPAEITKIAGEDFDIDKLYVMIPNIRSVYAWDSLRHDFNVAHDFLSWREANGYTGKSLKEIVDIIDNKGQLDTATEAEKLFEKQFNEFVRKGKSKYFVRAEKITYGGIGTLIKDKDTSKLTKRQRDNALIDINRMIWSDPSVSDQVINPGGADQLKALAIEKRKKRGVNENANPLLPRTQMKYFQGNTSGSQLIGIGANHNVNHAIAQFSELELTKQVLINGKKLTKLNKQKDLDNNLISRNLAEFLTAFVDNAKDPIAGDLNINTFTFDTVAMLTRLGFNLETVTDFINQPIIEYFTQEYYRAGGSMTAEKTVYEKILKKLYSKGKFTVEVQAHNINLDLLKDAPDINPDTYTPDIAEEQLRVLFSFMEYKNQANSLAKFVRATRNDSLGTRKTMAGNTKAMMDMEKAMLDKNLIGVADILTGDAYKLIKEGTLYGLIKPQQEILDKLFPYYKTGYKELYRKLEENKGSDLTEDEINYVNNLTLVYYGTGFNHFNLSEKSYWLNEYPKEFQKTLYQKVEGENIAELNPKFEEYELLKYITFKRADEEGGLDRIEFISGATMSNEQREYIQRSWESMLVSDDPDIQALAKELVHYSFHTNGMTFSYGGFSHLIPTTYLDKLVDDQQINFRDYLYKLQENAQNPKMFDNFIEQMFRHDVKRWGLLPQLKDEDISTRIFKNGMTTSLTLAAKNKLINFDEVGEVASKYFKIWNGPKGKYLTYKFVGNTPSGDYVYNVMEPLGSGASIYEYDSTSPGVNSVLKENTMPKFEADAFYPTTDENMPGEEMPQLNSTRELEFKYGLRDGNGVYKSYGKEGKGQSSTKAYGEAMADARRLNREILGSGFKATVGKQDDRQGGVNFIVQIVDEFYQAEQKGLEPDQQLNNLLVQRMSEFGVKVEHTEDFIKRMGKDINAVTNAVQKTILVSKQLENKTTLPEEVGHIAEAYNRGSMAHNRLMELIVHTPEYAEAKRDYSEVYGNNETKIRQEAIGKLIGNTLIKQTTAVNNTVLTFLTKLWNDFLNLFKNVNQYTLQNEIDAITGKISTDVIEGNFEKWNTNVAIEGEFFQISTAPAEEVEQILKNSIDSIYKKIKIYERKSLKSFTEREKEIYNDLSLALAKGKHKQGLLKYVKNAAQEMQKVMTRYEKMNHNPQTNEEKRDTLKTLKQMDNYVSGFETILNEIASSNVFEANTAAEKNLNRFVSSVSTVASKLKKQYYKVGKPILTDILKEFSTNPNVDIAGALDILEKDISWGNRMLDELASSGEPILAIIDKMTKEHKNRARVKTVGMSKSILQLQKELEKAGIPTTHFMYERDHQGKLTGNIISEYNEGEWNNRRKEFFKNNPKPEEPKSTDKMVQKEYKAKMKLWKAEIGKWFEKNTQPHPGKDKIMAAKRAEMVEKYGTKTTRSAEGNLVSLAELNYNAWLGENTIQSTYFDHQTGEPTYNVKYKKELAIPSEEYRNQVYADIYNDQGSIQQQAMKKYHQEATRILEELDKELPEYYKLDGMAPQIRKDFFERLSVTDNEGTKSFKSLKQIGKETKESFAENFVRHENDTEYGLTDENNQPVNMLPVRFTRRLQDPSNLSLDLTSSLIAFAYTANDFTEMSKIVDVLEYTKDVVGERKVRTGKFDPVTIFKNKDNKGRPITIDGKDSMAYKRLDDWMKMVVYGQSSKVEGEIFGVDKGKLVDFVNSYTSLASLALNLYSGISNVTVGYAMTKMEAVAGEFFSNADARTADRIYANELPNGLANIGQRVSDSKLDLWLEHMNTMQNYDRDYRNVDAARNTLFGRLFKTSSLYFMSHAGEHLIQSRLSLALANNTKVKDKDGKEMTLWDAFEVVGNELKLREGFTKVAGKKTTHLFKKEEDGQPLTEKDIFRFINRQNFLNKRMHGIYNDVDKMAAQQYALARLGLMFRKFIIPGWNRRFTKMTYNEEGEATTEGYYRTAFRFFGLVDRELNEAKFSLGKNWENLSDADKANFHRLFTEWAFMIGSVVIGGVLTQFAEDDEDNYLLNLAAYEAYRTYSEIRFFTSFTEMWRIVKSPAPSMYTVDKLIKFMEVWNWNEEITRGPYKGHTKFEQGFSKIVPLGGTIINIVTPEEQLKFYTNNKVSWF